MNTKSITEGALIAVISLILSLISYYIPLFSGFTYFIMPIPTIVMFKRHGAIPAALTSITASLLLLLFMDPVNALLLAIFIVLPGLFLGYTYYTNQTGGRRVAFGYFGFFIAILIELLVVQFVSGVPFVEEFTNEIKTITQTVKETYQSAGLLEGNQGEELLTRIDSMVSTIQMSLPTIMLLIPLIFSYATVLLTDTFFRYLKINYIPVKKITEWKFSTFTKNFLAIATFIVFILNAFLRGSSYEIYTFTLENIITGIYALMGLSFIFWYLSYRFKKRLIAVRILILIFCMLVGISISILMIIGVFDIYFDIKKFILRRNNDKA